MGISIHYRGKIDDISMIDTLRSEVVIIAEKMDWSYIRLDEDWSKPANVSIEVTEQDSQLIGNLPLKGIQLIPHPKCEALQFYFDYDGHLCDPVSMAMISEGTLKSEDVWVSVKTQFAGPETHMRIVGLLKYFKERYITNLEVHDEGKYWESGNLETLSAKMDLINEKIDMFSNELFKVNRGHIDKFLPDELASMIEALVSNKI